MTSTQALGSPPSVTSANEDRQRMLRERLSRAREEADRGAGDSSTARTRSTSPSRYGNDPSKHSRRESPPYHSYRSRESHPPGPPGPPPRREEYDRYQPRRRDDDSRRAPPPHWDQSPSQFSNRRYYDEKPHSDPSDRYHRDQEYGAPPPGVWGRRGPRENGGPEGDINSMPRHQPGGFHGANIAGTGDFFTSRNEERKRSTLSIWPPSPKSPYQSDSDDRGKKGKKSKSRQSSARSKGHKTSRHHSSRKRRHEDGTDSSDYSEEDYRRRRRKEKERYREAAENERRARENHHRSSHSRGYEEDRDAERSDRRRSQRSNSRSDRPRSRERRHKRSSRRSPSQSSSSSSSDEDDENLPTISSRADGRPDGFQIGRASKTEQAEASDDDDIGPKLPRTADGRIIDPRAYGGALLPGEGSAMAAFLQDGKRIPRRGEIGLSSEQIEDYEKVGYVMSGSRHARMNAVRMRKENQVISAEEKRTLLKMRNEEKEKKEREIVGQFREMLDTMQPGGH